MSSIVLFHGTPTVILLAGNFSVRMAGRAAVRVYLYLRPGLSSGVSHDSFVDEILDKDSEARALDF